MPPFLYPSATTHYSPELYWLSIKQARQNISKQLPFKDNEGNNFSFCMPDGVIRDVLWIISGPNFYLSGFFEAKREQYVHHLGDISRVNDWGGWITFFLEAIAVQAEKNTRQVNEILRLYDRMKLDIQQITHSQFSAQIVDGIFSYPIANSAILTKATNAPGQSVLKLIRQLKDAGILLTVREKSGRSPAIYAFPELVNITEGKNIFTQVNE